MPSLKCPTCGETSQNVMITETCVFCGGRLDIAHFERVYTPGGVDLRDVARYQRWLVRFFPVVFGAHLLRFLPLAPSFLTSHATLFLVFVVLVVLICEILLLHALNSSIEMVTIYALLTFIPFLNMVILFLANARAIETLKVAGIQVGVFGASDTAARAAMEANLCKKCGYNLTGNTSGVCPECGTTIYGLKGRATASTRPKPTECGRCGSDLTQTPNGNCPECDPSII